MMCSLSIIIPIYNVEKYIGKCIESVINQTYRQFEIILVNDCTPDKSVEVAESLLAAQDEIPYRIITMPINSGIAEVRNTGIDAATGKFVLFVDSDDWIEANMLERLVETALQEQADMVYCRVRQVYEGSKRSETLSSLPAGRWDKDEVLLAIFKGVVPTHMYKILTLKELYDGVQFPKCLVYEDVLTLPYLIDKARTIYFIDDVLYNYVQRQGSLTKSFNPNLGEVVNASSALNSFFSEKLANVAFQLAYKRYEYLMYHVIACHAVYYSPTYEIAKNTLLACRNMLHVRIILRLLVYKPSRTIAELLLLKASPSRFYANHYKGELKMT